MPPLFWYNVNDQINTPKKEFNSLVQIKDRKHFVIHKCINLKCSYYLARKLPQKALNKSVINPLFGKILSKIGPKASKQSFTDLFASAVPILGAAFSGGLTYVTFMPRCYKLRNTLRRYRLCDPDFYTKERAAKPQAKKI